MVRRKTKKKAGKERERGQKRYFVYKVVVVGEDGVGKNTLTEAFGSKSQKSNLGDTFGMDVYAKHNIRTADGNYADLIFVNLSSKPSLDFVTKNVFLTGTQMGILLFALDDYKSFKELDNWNNALVNYLNPARSVVVGNKNEIILLKKSRQVSRSDAIDFTKKIGAKAYFEISALNKTHTDSLLEFSANLCTYEKNLTRFSPTTKSHFKQFFRGIAFSSNLRGNYYMEPSLLK